MLQLLVYLFALISGFALIYFVFINMVLSSEEPYLLDPQDD